MNLSLPPERAEGGSEIRMKASRIISVLLTASLTVNFCGCSGPFDFGKKEIKEFTSKLEKGLQIAERRMLEEKALHDETIVVSNAEGKIEYIPAKEVLTSY